jgi:MtN3 and saliva related transmembrane protein
MKSIQWLGILAGILTTVSFLPQVMKTWKSQSAKDLSLGMFLIFSLGIALWLVYGILINDLPVILANMVTLVLSLTLLFFKFRFKQ